MIEKESAFGPHRSMGPFTNPNQQPQMPSTAGPGAGMGLDGRPKNLPPGFNPNHITGAYNGHPAPPGKYRLQFRIFFVFQLA